MRQNKFIKQITLISLSLFSFVGFFGNAAELELEKYLIQLNDNLIIRELNIDTKGIIEKYCNGILENTLKFDETKSYKANESAFVYILCTNIDNKLEKKFENIKEYFTGTSFKQLGIKELSPDNKTDYCSPAGSNMNNCNIPEKISKIFKIIINDYINLKQASMYGLTKKIESKDTIEELANKFGEKHFFIEICNSKKTGITYSKSCNIVKSYIQSATMMIKNLKTIDKEKIYTTTTNNLIYNGVIKEYEQEKQKTNDIYKGNTTFIDLTNALYNELFFFRIFVDYYNKTLPSYYNNSLGNKSLNLTEQIMNFNNEFDRMEKSISTTVRNIRDLYTSFPIHIGLVMYYEDILKLGKELQGISKPIYNLYDKFRNVQKPSK